MQPRGFPVPGLGTYGVFVKQAATFSSGTRFALHSRQGESDRFMTVASVSQNLYEFAIELSQLAYTMPGGHEDPLIHLSERMVRCASEQAAHHYGLHG